MRATDARYRSGFGTLFELEDARRSALRAQITLIELRRERVAAWIALYRALGGGWSERPDAATAANATRAAARRHDRGRARRRALAAAAAFARRSARLPSLALRAQAVDDKKAAPRPSPR